MSDTEFQSGMPRQLRDYWVHGAGAARIRWGVPGDFNRCVRLLTQESHGTIPDPKGTCANLHHEALGVWPGREHGAEDLQVLVAAMGLWTPRRWRGPLAPIGKRTGDGRLFPAATIEFQSFPMPLRWQEHGTRGHDGAVTVGVIEDAEEGVDDDGSPALMGRGYFLNPDVIPEVTKALHQVENGVSGPSVDLDSYTARIVEYAGESTQVVSTGRVRAATLVAVPAFADLRLQLDPEEGEIPFDLAASAAEFAVTNTTGWRGAPIAPRNALFDADDAVKRIQAWSEGDARKMASVFLWIDPDQGGGVVLGGKGYRLPWGDIVDGKPHVIYHAIYAAAALLEGGHGGLPNIPESDKDKLRGTISQIYKRISAEYEDPNIRASWDVATTPQEG